MSDDQSTHRNLTFDQLLRYMKGKPLKEDNPPKNEMYGIGEVADYGGLPVRYPNWKFTEYEELPPFSRKKKIKIDLSGK